MTDCKGDLLLRDIFDRIDMQLSLARSCQSQLRADFVDHSMEFELMRDCYKSLEEVSKLREELSAREEFYGMKLEFLNEQNLKLNCDIVDNIDHFPDYICDEFFNGDIKLGYEKLQNLYFSLDRVDCAFKKLLNKISLLGKVYGNGPFGLFDKENMETEQISEKNRFFRDNVDSAPAYSARLIDEKEALNLCILELLEFVRKSNKVNLQFLLKSVNYIFDYTVAKSSLNKTKELARFKSSDFELVRENFKNEDRRKIAINKKSIAFKLSNYEIANGVKGKTVSDHTQFTLLQHEMGKQRRHFPVRQLVQRAGAAMQELCPCWMMTPLSVAQFLPPGKIDFDLVIIDEASQLKPEDAWGIIARGKQVIVVGDQKQMPPSDFFATSSDEDSDIEYEDSEISGGDSESILDASVLSLLSWSLKWHYRSQHESLIAPANNFSYDNNLILFPSPIRDFSEIGISISYVNGTVTKNKVVNIIEAQEIVKRVREILIEQAKKTKSKRLSLGVVTMNIHQQDCINDIIQKIRDDDDEFDSALIEMQSESLPEPFFVRNLENIQGDERDIIIISCTYAPYNEGGVLMQRFGPLNRIGGQRRFNVLITRAKRRMEVFSSIKSDQIQFEGKNLGVRDFHLFLKYAESGADYRVLPEVELNNNRDYDSPFEKQVDEILKHEGFITERQVGVAGYFIDLAVVHPKRKSLFAIGIECDGATYHSSKAARDRDRLREQILLERGWKLHRIWSTEWFHKPRQAKEKLLQAVREACV